MNRHDPILTVEVAMNSADGTYRLQTFTPGDPTSPRETVVDADTIPRGLRMLAATLEAEAGVFGR